jgi:hypothetical protein
MKVQAAIPQAMAAAVRAVSIGVRRILRKASLKS